MAQPLALPFSYIADANGAPLAGGLVYTYAAGTTTPQASYTDSSGTIPASNPVVLDSAGRATIWLSGTYKVVVKDSLGNTISTTDNISALNSTGDMSKSVYDPNNIQEQLVGISAVQTITNKTLTNPIIIGTTTNDNATAGAVGEYISSGVSAVSMSSGVAKNITSISLTRGDWDISGAVGFVPAGSTVITGAAGGINTTSASIPSYDQGSSFQIFSSAAGFIAGGGYCSPCGTIRLSLAVTTTIYLVGQVTFTTSTCTSAAFIGARRIR